MCAFPVMYSQCTGYSVNRLSVLILQNTESHSLSFDDLTVEMHAHAMYFVSFGITEVILLLYFILCHLGVLGRNVILRQKFQIARHTIE